MLVSTITRSLSSLPAFARLSPHMRELLMLPHDLFHQDWCCLLLAFGVRYNDMELLLRLLRYVCQLPVAVSPALQSMCDAMLVSRTGYAAPISPPSEHLRVSEVPVPSLVASVTSIACMDDFMFMRDALNVFCVDINPASRHYGEIVASGACALLTDEAPAAGPFSSIVVHAPSRRVFLSRQPRRDELDARTLRFTVLDKTLQAELHVCAVLLSNPVVTIEHIIGNGHVLQIVYCSEAHTRHFDTFDLSQWNTGMHVLLYDATG